MHISATVDHFRGGAPARSPLYVLFLAVIAAISGFLFGFDTAVINGVLLFLERQFALSTVQTEIAASALLLGCLFGAAGASLVGDRIGRRKSLLLAAILFAASTIGAALANSIVVFSVGRFAGGLAIGLSSVLTPVYIAEVAPARSRGRLVSMNQLAIVVGILVAYVVSWGLSGLGNVSWRWMLGVAALPALAFFVGLLFIPESPRWLISSGQREQGRKVLVRIYGPEQADVQVGLVEEAASTEEGSWSEVFSPSMRRPLIVALGLAILCQITGINTVLYYGSIIISEHFKGQTTGTALMANIIIGLVNLVSTFVALYCLDRWGRRTMLLTGSAGMAVWLALFVVAYRIPGVSPLLVLACIIGYTGFFAFAMGPIPWVVISEIFPNKIRGRAASIATSTLWTGTLIVTLTFLSLVRALGVSGTFGIYAVLSVVAFLFIWKMVPETKGKTLEQIQHELHM
ncbi:MAG TPA: sugar porter family MFS transporter [Acidobacteriaceae bacterium]|jgi:SP family arabinose:H+ symporter-like MFS transporter|nr:sugar porter family MFS transporter [Acidobacteriaceae bacterium]